MDSVTDQLAPTLQIRLERQLKAMLSISRRWRRYESDLKTALKAITETAAAALDVERASIWLLDDTRESAICHDLYEHQRHRHTRGFKLHRHDHVKYFEALEREELVAATDAHTDPRTKSFADGYLNVHGIGAMLDAPIRVGGRLVGVTCNEHVGGERLFMADEQATAVYLANLVSLALELDGRREGERRLAHAHALLAAAVDSAGLGVFATDTKGKVIHFNSRLQGIWGFPDELMVDDPTYSVRLEFAAEKVKDKGGFVKRMRTMIDDPAAGLRPERVELKDGRLLEVASLPQVVDGKIVGRVWTVRQVTE